MKKLRVLVVEDSLTVRARLVEILSSAPDIEVVGEAGDGRRAIELCSELRPDVVTLDMMLPVMTGVAATEYIMAYVPTPILIVSSSTNRGELFRTYDALSAGAVDVLEKPRGDEREGVWEEAFLARVRLVSRIKVITHPRARLGLSRPDSVAPPLPNAPNEPIALVAIGASTGGPAAIVDVLRAIPAPFAVPIVVVIHLGAPFGGAFADWLDGQTHHRVGFARDGESLLSARGRVVLAPPDRHLALDGARFVLLDSPERHSCRPSVDVLFESIARARIAAVAALLTGMGRDGAAGLAALRAAGSLTIAQDEATSIVFGMPREAILLGAAARVLPLDAIGPAIADAVPRSTKGASR